MPGAHLPPLLGLARLALGVVAPPLLGDVPEALSAENSAQTGQPLLARPLAIIVELRRL